MSACFFGSVIGHSIQLLLINRRKFVYQLTFHETTFTIKYYNRFLVARDISFTVHDSSINFVEESNQWWGKPHLMLVGAAGEDFRFTVLSSSLLRELEATVNNAVA